MNKYVSPAIRRQRDESDLEFWIRWREKVYFRLDAVNGYERDALLALLESLQRAIRDESSEAEVERLRTLEDSMKPEMAMNELMRRDGSDS